MRYSSMIWYKMLQSDRLIVRLPKSPLVSSSTLPTGTHWLTDLSEWWLLLLIKGIEMHKTCHSQLTNLHRGREASFMPLLEGYYKRIMFGGALKYSQLFSIVWLWERAMNIASQGHFGELVATNVVSIAASSALLEMPLCCMVFDCYYWCNQLISRTISGRET